MKLRDLERNGLKILQNWWIEILSISVLITLIWAGYVWLVTGRWPDWTGFGEYIGPAVPQDKTFQRAKTLWDLMDLLIVPIVLAGGAYWLNKSVSQEEAKQRAEIDRNIAADNKHEDALQTYLDRMAELFLDEELSESEPESKVRAMAWARTLTALRNLDKDRKGILLRFIYDAGLIRKDKIVIDLSGADLSKAELREANMRETNMSGANLREANLSGANLMKANLSMANLSGADLSRADLNWVVLNWWVDLSGADLRAANLRYLADRGGINLKGARYNNLTQWPADDSIDPSTEGAILIKE